MLNIPPFYHGLTRKIIVAFGSMFSNIRIERRDNAGVLQQTIAVPVAYAPKEKWLVRLEQDPTLQQHVYTVLPRLSFEITNMTYDSVRKVNRMNKITCYDKTVSPPTVKSQFSPVPYNIDISLYILTKTQEDALQIVEQIVPFFTPEFTLTISGIPDLHVDLDVPIILNGVTVQDEYDGDFQTRRFVTYTLNFTMKANFFGPIKVYPTARRTITNFVLTDTMGSFTCDPAVLAIGDVLSIAGTNTGTGSIDGYSDPKTYMITSIVGTAPNVTGGTINVGLCVSDSSVSVGLGSKTFKTGMIDASYKYSIGDRIQMIYNNDSSIWMQGDIISVEGSTITILVDAVNGSGTYASWTAYLITTPGTTTGCVVTAGSMSGSGFITNVAQQVDLGRKYVAIGDITTGDISQFWSDTF